MISQEGVNAEDGRLNLNMQRHKPHSETVCLDIKPLSVAGEYHSFQYFSLRVIPRAPTLSTHRSAAAVEQVKISHSQSCCKLIRVVKAVELQTGLKAGEVNIFN